MRRFALFVAFAASLLVVPLAAQAQSKTEVAVFAGGCFWCLESDMDKVPGVLETVSGYTGGSQANATYEAVSRGGTGHAEVVKIVFDPSKVTYAQLLDVFWHSIDPLTPNAQFCDRGEQYRSAIFYQSDAQRVAAEASKAKIQASGVLNGTIVTEITKGGPFYAAEDYHQDYYKKNPIRYKYYRASCGRDARVKEVWGASAH